MTDALDTTHGAGINGAIVVEGYDISSTSPAAHQTVNGNISFFAQNEMPVIDASPDFIITNSGAISLHANGDIIANTAGIVCNGLFSGVQIDIQADFDHDGIGDLYHQDPTGAQHNWETNMGGSIFLGAQNFYMVGASGVNPASGGMNIATNVDGNIEIQVANDFVLQGGSRVTGTSGVSLQSTGSLLVRAGNDILLEAGTGNSGVSVIAASLDTVLLAGRDIRAIGGASGIVVFSLIQGDQCFITAGRDIVNTPGAVGSSEASITSYTFPSIIKAGRDILFQYGPNGAEGGIIDNGVGCDVRAGGDIQWAMSLHTNPGESIYIQADAEMFPLFTAQIGPYLTATPLGTTQNISQDFQGAFAANTSPVGGGIEFVTTNGSISLYSAAHSTSGGLVNILFDEVTTNNAVRLASASGNISVGSFYNTEVANTIATAGAILITTDNDININTPT